MMEEIISYSVTLCGIVSCLVISYYLVIFVGNLAHCHVNRKLKKVCPKELNFTKVLCNKSIMFYYKVFINEKNLYYYIGDKKHSIKEEYSRSIKNFYKIVNIIIVILIILSALILILKLVEINVMANIVILMLILICTVSLNLFSLRCTSCEIKYNGEELRKNHVKSTIIYELLHSCTVVFFIIFATVCGIITNIGNDTDINVLKFVYGGLTGISFALQMNAGIMFAGELLNNDFKEWLESVIKETVKKSNLEENNEDVNTDKKHIENKKLIYMLNNNYRQAYAFIYLFTGILMSYFLSLPKEIQFKDIVYLFFCAILISYIIIYKITSYLIKKQSSKHSKLVNSIYEKEHYSNIIINT